MKALLVIAAITFCLMGCGTGDEDMNRSLNDGFSGTPPDNPELVDTTVRDNTNTLPGDNNQ